MPECKTTVADRGPQERHLDSMTEYAVSRGEEHSQEEVNGRTEFLSRPLLMLLGKGTAWPRVHVHTKRTTGKASFLYIRTHSTVTGISSPSSISLHICTFSSMYTTYSISLGFLHLFFLSFPCWSLPLD